MRSVLLISLAVLTLGLAAGCASTSGNSDGGGSGGTSGTGGTGGTSGTGGTGGQGGNGQGGSNQGSGGSGGAAATDCNPTCGAGKVCVGTGTEGGALIMPNDAGVCPSGSHLSGNFCQNNLGYACQPMPAACNGTLACPCASTLCPSTGPYSCQVASASELLCVELVP
jgi:hypothetical protein